MDIMILVNLTDMELKEYRHRLSDMTYDFNEEYNLDVKPIAKSDDHFQKWVSAYPFIVISIIAITILLQIIL